MQLAFVLKCFFLFAGFIITKYGFIVIFSVLVGM